MATVMAYLYNQVGEGRIRRSDIVFSIDAGTRDEIEATISKTGTTSWFRILMDLEKHGKPINRDDLQVYLKLRDARVDLGDMYESLRDMEIGLHDFIKKELVSEYGDEDWWRNGISAEIRAKCSAALERDEDPACERYAYTNFIDLAEIIEKQWSIFSKVLPKKLASNRKSLRNSLVKLNRIRNSVMHPIKGIKLTDRDFTLVRELKADFHLSQTNC